MPDRGPARRRERLADRAEVAAAGLHRVAAAAEQRSRSAPGRRVGVERRLRVEARPGRVDPAEEILRGHPAEADRILGSSSSARSAISRKQRWSSAAGLTGSLTGVGVGAAAKRAAASSTLSMPPLVNGKGGREVASNG